MFGGVGLRLRADGFGGVDAEGGRGGGHGFPQRDVRAVKYTLCFIIFYEYYIMLSQPLVAVLRLLGQTGDRRDKVGDERQS